MSSRDWLVKVGVLKPKEDAPLAVAQEVEDTAPTKRSRKGAKAEEPEPQAASSAAIDSVLKLLGLTT